MKNRSRLTFFSRLIVCLLILSMLPIAALAASKPSQAGSKVLSGGQRDFAFPVPGYSMLSSCFYDNRNHCALDFPAPQGTPVVASYAGEVIATYNGCSHNYGKSSSCCGSGFGNYVILKHDYVLKGGEHITLYSSYNHLTKATVYEGQTVSRGQQIGTMGSTGYSTGHHLDYQILLGGYAPFRSYSIDPYINELLELPDGLHSMNSGGCCAAYVAYVNSNYPRCSHDAFSADGNCTECGYTYDWNESRSTAAMGIYSLNSDITPASKPYSASLGTSGSAISAGTKVSVSASVVNGLGEGWYQLENGGYLPKSALSFAEYFPSDFQGQITSVSEGQTLKQQSHTLSGSVSSRYPLRKVNAYLDGNYYAGWTGSGNATSLSIAGTDINNKLYFSTLAPGKHTLTITATDASGRDETTVITRIFYIEQPPTFYTVTFDCAGGSCETGSASVQEGNAIGWLPAPEKDGHIFTGWYSESGEAATEETVITGTTTLIAQWQPLNCTVAFGGILKTGTYGQPMDSLPVPTWDGYQFIGWYTEKEGGEEFTADTPVTGDITLYPRWEGRKYQVTLDPNGGTIAWHRKNVTLGKNYGAFPPVTREGYRFVGWSVGSTLITNTTPMTTARDHTLTAVWEALETEPPATEPFENAAATADSSGAIWWLIVGIAIALCAGITVWIVIRRKQKAAQNMETIPEEPPVEETPVEETPVEEAPVEETPVEEAPAEETPAEETPAEETPAEETPAEEAPVI